MSKTYKIRTWKAKDFLFKKKQKCLKIRTWKAKILFKIEQKCLKIRTWKAKSFISNRAKMSQNKDMES